MDYATSGVDIDAGNEAVRRIRALARSTFTPGVLSDIGTFGGLFRLDTAAMREPVLVSSADGVGTKLKVAFATGRHDTIGIDLVNHCVNDILVQGARPLFFLDYLATGHLSPEVVEQVVTGIAAACRHNDCALIGGETAEMPDFYAEGEYDLAGFIVGWAERDRLIDGGAASPGDVLVGLPSSGLHTNGYSLARRIVFDTLRLTVDREVPELGGTVGDVLLTPHRSYLRPVSRLLEQGLVKGMAHITGGGLTENVPRMLPTGVAARIETRRWTPPPVFGFLAGAGRVPRAEMFRAFNMGIGLVLVCGAEAVTRVIESLERDDCAGVVIGELVAGSGVVYDRPL